MTHRTAESTIKPLLFALGMLVEIFVFVAIVVGFASKLTEGFSSVGLVIASLMFFCLLIHHYFIFESFHLFDQSIGTEASAAPKLGCSVAWLKHRYHRRLCIIIALVFAGLTGEIPYLLITFVQLPLPGMAERRAWLIEHHGTSIIFIATSLVLALLLVLWSIMAKFFRDENSPVNDVPADPSVVTFKLVNIYLFTDALATLNWAILLTMIVSEKYEFSSFLSWTAGAYVILIGWRAGRWRRQRKQPEAATS